MTSVYLIGKNNDKCLLHIWDATGKKKLAPDRSGNVMVSPEKLFCFVREMDFLFLAFSSLVRIEGLPS